MKTDDQPLVCDFCSTPDIAWSYPVLSFEAFEFVTFGQMSLGDWAACETCHALIAAGNARGLLNRSVDTMILENPELLERYGRLRTMTAELHAKFWANRQGDPRRIEELKPAA
jgi:hypothetical protein